MSFEMHVEVGVTDREIAAAMHYNNEFAINVLKEVAETVSPNDLVDLLSEEGDLANVRTFVAALLRVVEEAMA